MRIEMNWGGGFIRLSFNENLIGGVHRSVHIEIHSDSICHISGTTTLLREKHF